MYESRTKAKLSNIEPGGYVQWVEFDTTVQRAAGAGGDATGPAVAKVLGILNDDGEQYVFFPAFYSHVLGFSCLRRFVFDNKPMP